MWEYISIEEGEVKKLVHKLNELGKEKWEAFGFANFTGAFGKFHFLVLLKRLK